MQFDDVRAFVAVAEARSVSRAARELHLTQPAVTRRVQRLESSLGVTLCDRRRRPFTLTAAGQAALERCRRVLHALHDVQATATPDDPPAREVRIGGWSRDLLERVRAGSLDAAVILLADGERLPGGLDAVPVGRERLLVIEPRRPRRSRSGVGGLDGAGWVLNPDGCAARALLQRALHHAHLRMRVAVETYTYELQLALVARGTRPRPRARPHPDAEPPARPATGPSGTGSRLPAHDLVGAAGGRRRSHAPPPHARSGPDRSALRSARTSRP